MICYTILLSGANITLECTNKIIQIMNELIHDKYKCDAPPVLSLQSDNGPECKNISVNAWCTLLVEMDIFKTIYVQYLIAGTLPVIIIIIYYYYYYMLLLLHRSHS
jgi:hypothetical protein